MSNDKKTAPAPLEKHKGTPRVSMSNALARSAHGLSLHEKRLVALCVSKLDSGRHWTAERLVVRVTVAEYRWAFGIMNDANVYRDLRNATQALEKQLIVFYEEAKRGTVEHHMRWVGRASYAEKQGWVELAFWHELAPHLFMLKKQFTTYHLRQASALRSNYSWRLLELLMQFHDTQRLMIGLDEFHHAMETPESCRKAFPALRRRVIEPAIKELRDREGLIVSVEPRKNGRKIVSLDFSFGYQPQQGWQF